VRNPADAAATMLTNDSHFIGNLDHLIIYSFKYAYNYEIGLLQQTWGIFPCSWRSMRVEVCVEAVEALKKKMFQSNVVIIPVDRQMLGVFLTQCVLMVNTVLTRFNFYVVICIHTCNKYFTVKLLTVVECQRIFASDMEPHVAFNADDIFSSLCLVPTECSMRTVLLAQCYIASRMASIIWLPSAITCSNRYCSNLWA